PLRNRHTGGLRAGLDRRAGVDADEVRGLHRGRVDWRDRLLVGAAPAATPPGAPLGLVGRTALLAAGGLRVDHDASAPARADLAGRALTRARIARGPHTLRDRRARSWRRGASLRWGSGGSSRTGGGGRAC